MNARQPIASRNILYTHRYMCSVLLESAQKWTFTQLLSQRTLIIRISSAYQCRFQPDWSPRSQSERQLRSRCTCAPWFVWCAWYPGRACGRLGWLTLETFSLLRKEYCLSFHFCLDLWQFIMGPVILRRFLEPHETRFSLFILRVRVYLSDLWVQYDYIR